uniref:Proteasome component Ecm29 N-terminal domain-containing protein n=1 Tax=Glossina palpalis gambiensis TaxID=67801 RepID=A0A1B0BY52_9MUSC
MRQVSVYAKRNMKKNEMVGWFSLGLNSPGPEEVAHWVYMRDMVKGELLARWHLGRGRALRTLSSFPSSKDNSKLKKLKEEQNLNHDNINAFYCAIVQTDEKLEARVGRFLIPIRKGMVRFICAGIFTDKEIFILLIVASADTRFSVATPALAELSMMIDFTDHIITMPLYILFSGNNAAQLKRKTTHCCGRVGQKLLIYLISCRGKAINAANGIQVILGGLFGENTNQKCKVLSLQFAEILIKE